MHPRFARLGVAACAGLLAACSQFGSNTVPTSAANWVTPRASTPIAYYYALESDRVAQWKLVPSVKTGLVTAAPDFKLPSSCTSPTAIRLVPSKNLAFIACSSEILPLRLNRKHALTASATHPVNVAAPVSLIAPATGVSDMLYADLSAGGITALSYNGGLKLVGTYPMTSSGPNEMAFYSNGTTSSLYVAAFADQDGCNGPGGAIDVWTQNGDGSLTVGTPIQNCNNAQHVVIVGSMLYWAGFSVLGGYNLATNSAVTLPAPPWVTTKNGPSLDGDSMAAVVPTSATAARSESPALKYVYLFATANSYGGVTIFDDAGNAHTVALPPNSTTACYIRKFSPPIVIDGAKYTVLGVCIGSDGLGTLWGRTPTEKTVQIGSQQLFGTNPDDIQSAALNDFHKP